MVIAREVNLSNPGLAPLREFSVQLRLQGTRPRHHRFPEQYRYLPGRIREIQPSTAQLLNGRCWEGL